MAVRVIKTNDDYDAALKRIASLMDSQPDTPEAEELEVLATLVEHYEREHYPIDLPDPIEAIRFRMEQAGLRQQDLVPVIGARSKVSEVLNGKRPLTLRMIRNLHSQLGIPADVLLQEPGASLPSEYPDLEFGRFPLVEMVRRNWLPKLRVPLTEVKDHAEELIRGFLRPVENATHKPALLRQNVRSGSSMDEYALLAWQIRVLTIASEQTIEEYEPGAVTMESMRQMVSLSFLEQGPRLAAEFLAKAGIHLVTLAHLPRTHLDGAAMLSLTGAPLVALTLRHDRLDNFWFTLCHELAHVALHLRSPETECFIDDLERTAPCDSDRIELEADRFASPLMYRNSHQARESAPPLSPAGSVVSNRITAFSRNSWGADVSASCFPISTVLLTPARKDTRDGASP
jgi:HTH-type transcriptional regulator/antitoxin HigA